MPVSRRFSRPLTLACATAALALAPGAALATPRIDPPVSKPGPDPIIVERASAPIVRGGDNDTTLALIISGSALLVAVGGAGLAGRDHRRIRHLT